MAREDARLVVGESASAPLNDLDRGRDGLTSAEAAQSLRHYGPNELHEPLHLTWLSVLWAQFRSPLLLLLVVAAAISLGTGQWVDATIVLAIVVVSASGRA
jgi:magnesium-transporting ATPase (P-type)